MMWRDWKRVKAWDWERDQMQWKRIVEGHWEERRWM